MQRDREHAREEEAWSAMHGAVVAVNDGEPAMELSMVESSEDEHFLSCRSGLLGKKHGACTPTPSMFAVLINIPSSFLLPYTQAAMFS